MNMNTNVLPKANIHMHRREFQRINKIKPGSTLFCDSGVLWVTQTGDRRDYVLFSGETMTVSKRGRVLVEAMRDANFYVA